MKQPHKATKKLLQEAQEERMERIKKATEPVDAIPILKFLMENKDKFTKEERKKMLDALQEGFELSGQMMIERALNEKHLTEEEYRELTSKGMTPIEFSAILSAYFHKIDCKNCNDKAVIITSEDTPVYKNKEILQKKFDIKIETPKKAFEMIKKDMEENNPEALKKINKLEKELFSKLKKKLKDKLDKRKDNGYEDNYM